jgi:hypothetical protein
MVGRVVGCAWALALAMGVAACSDAPSDDTPRGTVRLFLQAMERSERDPSALEDAYRLLARPTRRALMERAHMAGSLGGREFQPWEMLVRGRYRQTFTPRRGGRGMRESIEGDRATVTVTASDGERRAEIPLLREEDGWRIVIDMPPLRPEADAG